MREPRRRSIYQNEVLSSLAMPWQCLHRWKPYDIYNQWPTSNNLLSSGSWTLPCLLKRLIRNWLSFLLYNFRLLLLEKTNLIWLVVSTPLKKKSQNGKLVVCNVSGACNTGLWYGFHGLLLPTWSPFVKQYQWHDWLGWSDLYDFHRS